MPQKRQVYLLDAQKLNAETIAVTFAKTSRSPATFREIAQELTDEKSAKFHEKWVVGYGHASVAEHAVLHVAFENISRLATEALQSSRLASFTEKSTRYQVWGKSDYCIPPEILGTTHETLFRRTVGNLFSTYLKIVPQVSEWYKLQIKKETEESDNSFNQRIKVMAIDVCRFLLPAASAANVGMTINAREMEHLLCKLFSHPLAEVREIAKEMYDAARQATPTLIKYAKEVPYLKNSYKSVDEITMDFSQRQSDAPSCKLIDWDQEGERNILAAALFKNGTMSFETTYEFIERMGEVELDELSQRMLGSLGEHDQPLRELEYANLSFSLTLDQGAYYELKRHRMMTLTAQRLSTYLGFETPKAIVEAGCFKNYSSAMQKADKAYRTIYADFPEAAAYIVPNGYLRNILIKFNLREAFHLVPLRTGPNAHFSIRMIVQWIAQEIKNIYPHLGKYLRENKNETVQGIRDQYFYKKKR